MCILLLLYKIYVYMINIYRVVAKVNICTQMMAHLHAKFAQPHWQRNTSQRGRTVNSDAEP